MSDFDQHPNLAIGTIVTPPSPFTSGTTFKLAAPEAALFRPSMPTTIAPAGAMPSVTNAEIGYIADVSGTTITFLRGQETSTAKSIRAGWKVYGSATAKTFTDIESAIEQKVALAGDLGGTQSTPKVTFAHFTPSGFRITDDQSIDWLVTINADGSLTTTPVPPEPNTDAAGLAPLLLTLW